MKIAVIGVGNLGFAIVKAIINTNICGHGELILVERRLEKHATIQQQTNVLPEPRISETLAQAEIVLLAIKPQDFPDLASRLKNHLKPQQLVLSIMAGISIARMAELLAGHQNIVRSMPNLPAQIGQAATVFVCANNCAENAGALAHQLLASFGVCVQVHDEGLLDTAVALVGSGPGFMFYLIEALLEVSQELGLTLEQAKLLVGQTLTGSVNLWRETGREAGDLRQAVTSKAGTTAAGLEVLEQHHAKEIIKQTIRRARARSLELGK